VVGVRDEQQRLLDLAVPEPAAQLLVVRVERQGPPRRGGQSLEARNGNPLARRVETGPSTVVTGPDSTTCAPDPYRTFSIVTSKPFDATV
jgi:hypothetical protein